jgi:hypothetical protein
MEFFLNSDIQMENQQGKTYIGQVQTDCFCQVNIFQFHSLLFDPIDHYTTNVVAIENVAYNVNIV